MASWTSEKLYNAERLLESLAPDFYLYYKEHIHHVRTGGKYNGIDFGTNTLFLTEEFLRNSSIEYIASAMVHDAYHVETESGCTAESEGEAIGVQIEVLEQIGGSQRDLNFLRSIRGTYDGDC